VAALAAPAAADARTVVVRSDAQLAGAVRALARTGGTIHLRPGRYRRLVVGPRSWRPLRIVGRRGVRIERVLFDGAKRVSLGGVAIAPIRGDALVEVRGSHHVDLHDLRITAHRTRWSSSILIPDSHHVTIRRSDFSHCGDRSPHWTNCLWLYRWSRNILVQGNRFHDCYGCDFIHGRFAAGLTIRGNRFERALPCRMGGERCRHQDLIELFAGRFLRVERNHFGVYREGGAQLYITNNVDNALIVNNVFRGSDPRVPGYRARMGIIVGSAESKRLPHRVIVVNNTILTGWRRRDGYSGSIRLSSRYGGVPRRLRPIVVNNVIGLLETPARVCNGTKQFAGNVIVRGRSCSETGLVGQIVVDRRGRPTAASALLIDAGVVRYAPSHDIQGRRRSGFPDVGAYEYRP
jgi:hypothetical protein